MKPLKLWAASLITLITVTSCDFTEECQYESRLNIHNNWLNYREVPATNHAIAYDLSGKSRGPVEIRPGANGKADSVSCTLPFGSYQVLTFTDAQFSQRTKIDTGSLDSPESACVYVETEPVDIQDGRVLLNPQFPGYFYTSYNTGDLNLRVPVTCSAIQQQHTRFVRFLYNVVYESGSQPAVRSITTELTGIATRMLLKNGEGVPQSAVTAYARPEYTKVEDVLSGAEKSYFVNQVSALNFLPKTANNAATNNTIKVNAFLDDITVRSASLDLTDYFDTFTNNYATVKIDVVIEKNGLHLELAAWELGVWKEFVIK